MLENINLSWIRFGFGYLGPLLFALRFGAIGIWRACMHPFNLIVLVVVVGINKKPVVWNQSIATDEVLFWVRKRRLISLQVDRLQRFLQVVVYEIFSLFYGSLIHIGSDKIILKGVAEGSLGPVLHRFWFWVAQINWPASSTFTDLLYWPHCQGSELGSKQITTPSIDSLFVVRYIWLIIRLIFYCLKSHFGLLLTLEVWCFVLQVVFLHCVHSHVLITISLWQLVCVFNQVQRKILTFPHIFLKKILNRELVVLSIQVLPCHLLLTRIKNQVYRLNVVQGIEYQLTAPVLSLWYLAAFASTYLVQALVELFLFICP